MSDKKTKVRRRPEIAAASVIGIGKLGLSMVVALASRGIRVLGADVNARSVRLINQGKASIDETDVQKLLTRHRKNIKATLSIEQAVLGSDVSFLVVATPSGPDGAFINDQLLPAVEQVGQAIGKKDGYHVVAVTSTVMPGVTSGIVKPLLERASGKRCGKDFGLVYNPEFIALGSVVSDFLNPDFVLIGECDKRAGTTMEEFYRHVCLNNPPVARMLPAEAEIAKISLNCFCTMKIGFANMIAEIAEKVPGTDAAAITRGIGLDRRIGGMYLKPGLGFGGPCFPRDNVAFRTFAGKMGVKTPIPDAVHVSNRRQATRVVRAARRMLPRGGKIAVLGLSYKPATPVVEESQALEIASSLARAASYTVAVYDPMAMGPAKAILGNSVTYAKSLAGCLRKSDLCIVAVPWPEFGKLTATMLLANMRTARVIDCWRCLKPCEAAAVEYTAVGMGKKKGS